MLFATWHEIPMRPTRDVDLLGFGSPEVERLADVFRSICTESVTDDGLTFDPESVRAAPIRETNAYHGVRIRLGATLSGAKIPLQVDVGFGDAIVRIPVKLDTRSGANWTLVPEQTDQSSERSDAGPIL